MQLNIQNIGPLRGLHSINLNGISSISGENGLGKSTIIDSFGLLLYGPINIGGKNTKKYLELNNETDDAFIEISGLEISGIKYDKIRREIIRKGNRYITKLFINDEMVNNDYFINILSLDEFLLMTDYKYFSNLTGDKKLIMFNSFFDLDEKKILNKTINENIGDIENNINDINYKLNNNKDNEKISIKDIKKLFMSNFKYYGINDIKSFKSLDFVKKLSLLSNNDLKILNNKIDELFKLIQGIPKNKLNIKDKEQLNAQLIEIKEKKNKNLMNINEFTLFNNLSKIYNELIKLIGKNNININFLNGNFINENDININENLLFTIREYRQIKEKLVNNLSNLESFISNNNFFKNEIKDQLINLIKTNKIKDLLRIINGEILNKENIINSKIGNEILQNDGILIDLYNGNISFHKNNKEISKEDQLIISNFIKSKFISKEELKSIQELNKLKQELNKIINDVSSSFKSLMTIALNDTLKNISKGGFNNIINDFDYYTQIINFIKLNKNEYLQITKKLNIKSIDEISNYLNEKEDILGLTNLNTLEGERKKLDKEEFDIINKIKNINEHEKITNRFLELSQEYINNLNRKKELLVFNTISKKFLDIVLEQNYDTINDSIIKNSGGLLELNDTKKDNIQIVYNKNGLKIPYKNMSEGIKSLSDNILMKVIGDLYTQQGKSINFFLIDEISSISLDNRKKLFKGLNKKQLNIISITNNMKKLEINSNLTLTNLEKISKGDVINNINKKSKLGKIK